MQTFFPEDIQQGMVLLHFDAHPNLACPTVPAMACFAPRQAILEPIDEDDSLED